MYPAYTAKAALAEYAVTFFFLLNEGYKAMYRDYRMLSQIALIPHVENNARQKFLRDIDWAAKDVSDILKPRKPSSEEDIKRALG